MCEGNRKQRFKKDTFCQCPLDHATSCVRDYLNDKQIFFGGAPCLTMTRYLPRSILVLRSHRTRNPNFDSIIGRDAFRLGLGRRLAGIPPHGLT